MECPAAGDCQGRRRSGPNKPCLACWRAGYTFLALGRGGYALANHSAICLFSASVELLLGLPNCPPMFRLACNWVVDHRDDGMTFAVDQARDPTITSQKKKRFEMRHHHGSSPWIEVLRSPDSRLGLCSCRAERLAWSLADAEIAQPSTKAKRHQGGSSSHRQLTRQAAKHRAAPSSKLLGRSTDPSDARAPMLTTGGHTTQPLSLTDLVVILPSWLQLLVR